MRGGACHDEGSSSPHTCTHTYTHYIHTRTHIYITRDSAIINTLPLGVKARGTVPVKSLKGHAGEQGVAVAFAGVEFVEGWHVYADEDGVIVSEEELSLEEEE